MTVLVGRLRSQSCFGRLLSDQAGADSAEEVFAVGFGLGQNFWIVAIFEGDFLKEEFDGILGLEALRNELADARREAVGIVCRCEARVVISALVIAEFCRRQAVVGSFRVGVVQQRR